MLAKAGGGDGDCANATFTLDRRWSARISLADMNAGASRPLSPGDILFIPPAEKIYVYGRVQQPGAFNFVPGQTFRRACARRRPDARGLDQAHQGALQGKEAEGVNFDDAVQPEDVLVIREKLPEMIMGGMTWPSTERLQQWLGLLGGDAGRLIPSGSNMRRRPTTRRWCRSPDGASPARRRSRSGATRCLRRSNTRCRWSDRTGSPGA